MWGSYPLGESGYGSDNGFGGNFPDFPPVKEEDEFSAFDPLSQFDIHAAVIDHSFEFGGNFLSLSPVMEEGAGFSAFDHLLELDIKFPVITPSIDSGPSTSARDVISINDITDSGGGEERAAKRRQGQERRAIPLQNPFTMSPSLRKHYKASPRAETNSSGQVAARLYGLWLLFTQNLPSECPLYMSLECFERLKSTKPLVQINSYTASSITINIHVMFDELVHFRVMHSKKEHKEPTSEPGRYRWWSTSPCFKNRTLGKTCGGSIVSRSISGLPEPLMKRLFKISSESAETERLELMASFFYKLLLKHESKGKKCVPIDERMIEQGLTFGNSRKLFDTELPLDKCIDNVIRSLGLK